MKLYELKCFGTNIHTGNTALVVYDDKLSFNDRLSFTLKQNKPVCVFVDKNDSNDIVLDYYYPHMRSQLCLHGTLAFGYIYFKYNPDQTNLTITTSLTNQNLALKKNSFGIFLSLHTQYIKPIVLTNKLISQLLNITTELLPYFSNYIIASVGSPKLLIEVNNKQLLNSLVPNLSLIRTLSIEKGINGIFLYYKSDYDNYEGRNFNHLDPILEDSATGVAAAALTYYLQQGINVYQREFDNLTS